MKRIEEEALRPGDLLHADNGYNGLVLVTGINRGGDVLGRVSVSGLYKRYKISDTWVFYKFITVYKEYAQKL